MSVVALRAEGLGKQYWLGAGSSGSIHEAASQAFARLFRRPTRQTEDARNFWALRDVNFEIPAGEVVGIIGHNGAGKSTLLKILSRITEPTEGHAVVRGRIGSLLEVGTGFHPDLSGRDNVYLNGAVLGMSRSEIRRKFDEIVEFAGVERFLDMPVKRYSSGMYVRLAFAVAAHMEPEVLVVDEVLAVGDAEFQKKCFDVMANIGRSGRTIVFVSHNMSAVRHLCRRGIVLQNGRVTDDGPIDPVVDGYLAAHAGERFEYQDIDTGTFVLHDVRVRSAESDVVKTYDDVTIEVTFSPKRTIDDPGMLIALHNREHQRVTGVDFKDFLTIPALPAGQRTTLGFKIHDFPLLPGSYAVEVHLKDMATHTIDIVQTRFPFDVVETPVYGGRRIDEWYGSVAIHAEPYAKSPSVTSR